MLTRIKLEKQSFLLNDKSHRLFKTMLGICNVLFSLYLVETMRSFIYFTDSLQSASPSLRMVQHSGQRVQHSNWLKYWRRTPTQSRAMKWNFYQHWFSSTLRFLIFNYFLISFCESNFIFLNLNSWRDLS